ncbi:hypothetical protein ABZS96_14280 [Streptomyces avermitilis]|uniref:hypothetical protein n=1 Tax=Streptomyces avermitilis TaxID=33903 RepID=UPI0033BA8763
MMAWPAERVLAYGRFGILATVLLLPALEAPLPLVGALLPGQTAVAMGGLLAWHGRVPPPQAAATAGTCRRRALSGHPAASTMATPGPVPDDFRPALSRGRTDTE